MKSVTVPGKCSDDHVLPPSVTRNASSVGLPDVPPSPDPPFDFHDTDRFKCGSTDQDLYKIFMTGLDGSPMPSWSDNIKPDEAWSLVFYMRSLQPMHTKAKEIAEQLKLTPVNPLTGQ